MTKLMSTFIAKMQQMDEADQDLWAEAFLEQLSADDEFDRLIDSRPDVLRMLADAALAEEAAGLTSLLTESDFDLEAE